MEHKKEKTLLSKVVITIKHLRKQKNLSQEQLAHLAGLDRTYISGIERGTRNLTINSLESIIHALDISHSDFFTHLIKEHHNAVQDKPEC